jgi:hypothetical protein
MATCFPPTSTVVLVTAALWVAALLAPATAIAQSTTATILGTVTDSSDAVMPGVAVTIVNEGTNSQRTVTTDGTGGYEAPLLPPGAYRVEGELTGFKKIIRSGITLQVDQRARVDLVLDLGAVTETIEVRADAPLVQSESAGIGTVVDNAKIVELPLNGRDFFQLSTLVTGTAPPAEGSQNATQGGAVSVNGAREQSNNFLLDGIDNNSLAINQIVIPPSVDAVQEFKVQSSTYGAEFGRSGGGQFNYVTRSGTNAIHWSAYEFMRNAALDAKNFFDRADRDTPQYQRNQFGGTFGGPIRRDKLFFFGNYEGARIRQAFTRVATVPPTAWVNGDFSGLLTGAVDPDTGFDPGQLFDPRTFEPIDGNIIPPAMMDSAGAEIVKWYPAPDDANAVEPSSAVVAPVGRNDVNQMTARVDHNAGRDDRLFYRYSLWDENRFNPFDPLADPTNVPGFGSSTLNNGQSLAVGWTRTLGPRMVNDFRFGFNRLRAGIFQEHQGNDVSASLGITGLLTDPNAVGRPGIVVGITDPLLEATNLPQDRKDKTLQFNNSLSWLLGRHSLKTGVDVRHFALDFYLDVIARGQFVFVGLSGNPIADLLFGTPGVALRQNPEKNTFTNLRTTAFNWYVHDDWRVNDDLTLNVGLRYDYNKPVTDTQDRLSFPDFTDPAGGFTQVGTNGLSRAGYQADRNNLAPRVGAAWKPFHKPTTVVRGGYGVFYDVGILNVNLLPRLNPPQFALDLVLGFPGMPTFPLALQDAFSSEAESVPIVNGIDTSFHDGYYHQFSAGVQQGLRSDLLLEASYVGARGRDLPLFLDPNQGPPGGPPLRNEAYGPAQIAFSVGRSNYDSLQVRVERRFVRGLSVLSAYTWSRSRDNGSALFGSHASNLVPQNSFDVDAEWGPSDFDSPHRYVLSYVWELPVGNGKRFIDRKGLVDAILGNWELAGIATVQSGRPFTVYYGASANYSGTDNGANGGLGFDRPNQTGDPQPSKPDPSEWFDPGAFTPPDNTFGALGRNTLRSDRFENVDLAFYKNVSLGRGRMQFRIELFNAFNHPFFFLPIADLTNANAGKVVRAGDARQVQLGFKLTY